jgi:magnesium-transporting ATPase (P-type)
VGVVLAAGTLGTFWWTLRTHGDLELARTAAMTQMVLFQFFHVFNSRSLDRSVFRIPLLSNRFLFASLAAALAAHLAALYWAPLQALLRTQPLSGAQWLALAAVASTVVAGGELDKWWSRRRARPLG